jgi:hypothetical protein
MQTTYRWWFQLGESLMPRICYVPKRFRDATLGIITHANAIIKAYRAQGYRLTLRQIYYQMIARDLFPESWIDPVYNAKHGLPPDTKNTMKNYKRLGDILNDARLAGLIDWEAIEDRTRELQSNAHWDSPGQIVRACAQQFKFDLWGDQDYYCEVWIEKDALVGIIEGVCEELDVPYFACRGYTSQSEMWGAAQRLIDREMNGKDTVIFHLGDHDPSGKDMTRDIMDRLEMFGSSVDVRRIALNWAQVEEYNPPPNPAKTTDARYEAYRREWGDDSWELDALEPRVLTELIRDEVEELLDLERWDAQLERQVGARQELKLVAKKWSEVVETLREEE